MTDDSHLHHLHHGFPMDFNETSPASPRWRRLGPALGRQRGPRRGGGDADLGRGQGGGDHRRRHLGWAHGAMEPWAMGVEPDRVLINPWENQEAADGGLVDR